jgi:type VI secretion system protein VasG
MSVNLKSLIGKLNDTVRGALEGAAGLCLSRTHYDVEIEHFLMKLLDSSAGDMACILRHFEIDRTRLAGELTRTLDKFKSGNARTPSLSPTVVKMMTEAWTLGSIDFGSGQIRSGYTILALVSNEELSRLVRETSRELQKVNADALKKDFDKITATSNEDAELWQKPPELPGDSRVRQ